MSAHKDGNGNAQQHTWMVTLHQASCSGHRDETRFLTDKTRAVSSLRRGDYCGHCDECQKIASEAKTRCFILVGPTGKERPRRQTVDGVFSIRR